jgi:hypothetical protein
MRVFLKTSGRYLSVGWCWALVLLILPNCTNDYDGFVTQPGDNLFRGSLPHSAAIMCDIEKDRHCATDQDLLDGTPLASAAEALVAGKTGSNIGLDYSPDALAKCPDKRPIAVVFRGDFPRGYPVCLNCADTLGAGFYANANEVCAAQCEDFIGVINSDGILIPNNPPLPSDKAACEDLAHVHASTNFPLHECYLGVCSMGGIFDPLSVDPRIAPELVTWTGVSPALTAGPGTLSRIGGPSGWDAGAYSTQLITGSPQLITGGDGYVEFVAVETDKTRMCGLSSGATDSDASFTDIGYGIDLFNNAGQGQIIIFESGNPVVTLTNYDPNTKFRVKVTDKFNGTAEISYVKITDPCVDGSPCNETPLYTSLTPGAYPFRVDASLFDQGATLTDVRLVRIH